MAGDGSELPGTSRSAASVVDSSESVPTRSRRPNVRKIRRQVVGGVDQQLTHVDGIERPPAVDGLVTGNHESGKRRDVRRRKRRSLDNLVRRAADDQFGVGIRLRDGDEGRAQRDRRGDHVDRRESVLRFRPPAVDPSQVTLTAGRRDAESTTRTAHRHDIADTTPGTAEPAHCRFRPPPPSPRPCRSRNARQCRATRS